MLGTYLVFTRTARSPAHNYSYDLFLTNVLGTRVFTDAELRKYVWFLLTSANLRNYTLVALPGLQQLGRDIYLLVKCFLCVGTVVNAKSVYSRRDSATYSAFDIGYRLWQGVGEDAARAWRPDWNTTCE